jgi:hypothetical protein
MIKSPADPSNLSKFINIKMNEKSGVHTVPILAHLNPKIEEAPIIINEAVLLVD